MNCSNRTNFCSNVCSCFLILLSSFCTTMIKSITDLLFSLTCILVKFKTDKLTSKSCIICCWLLAKPLMFLFMLSSSFFETVPNSILINWHIIGNNGLLPLSLSTESDWYSSNILYTDLYETANRSISTCRLSKVSTYPVKFDLL